MTIFRNVTVTLLLLFSSYAVSQAMEKAEVLVVRFSHNKTQEISIAQRLDRGNYEEKILGYALYYGSNNVKTSENDSDLWRILELVFSTNNYSNKEFKRMMASLRENNQPK